MLRSTKAILWAGSLVLIAALTWIAPSFEECMSSALKAPVDGGFSWMQHLRLSIQCEGHFIDQNEGVITALASAAVAVFTLTLWRATDKLWKSGERQIEVAKISAEAAKKSADVAKASADAVVSQLRAYVGVMETRINGSADDATVDVTVKNSGQTPAHNMTMVVAATGFNEGDPRQFSPGTPAVSKAVLGPGALARKSIPLRNLMSTGIREGLRAGRLALYVYGEICYTDVFGNDRITTFRCHVGERDGYPEDGNMIVSPEGNEAT